MARRRLLLALPPLVMGAGVLVAACGDQPAAIGLVMHAPQGLLDTASGVRLSVFDAAGADCGADGATEVPDDAQQFDLENDGCDEGVGWCGEITLDRDNSTKMFAVVASNPAGILAQGCATATISQDPVVVDITVVRFVEAGCCNDGVVQPTETCDIGVAAPTDCAGGTGGVCVAQTPTELCECNCQTHEKALDRANGETVAPAALRWADVALAFAPGSGFTQNGLRGVFVDQTAASGPDLFLRVLKSDLGSICPNTEACNQAGEPPLPFGAPLEMPVGCAPTTGILRTQKEPAIASVTPDATAVVFASDADQVNQFNIVLNRQTADSCAENPGADGGVPVNPQVGGCSNPAIATGAGQRAFVVWEQNGQILSGRTWDPAQVAPNDFGALATIAVSGLAPRVGGGTNGWVVVYQGGGTGDPDAIVKKSVDAAGVVGPEVRVNTVTDGPQDQPDIAMFPDGSHAVVWHSASDVFFQRFAGDGAPVMGDQDAPIHTVSDGEQMLPAIGASVGLGNFYAVAWQHVDSGHIHGRYLLTGGGFGFNNVDGQNTDFLISAATTTGARRKPAVAIGGDGYVVVAWHDDSNEHPGVFYRRLPLPPE